MAIEFPYGQLSDAYLNVKEAAKEPWRGITAWVQGAPFLVIDKTDEGYKLEGMNHETLTLTNLERWQPATEHNSLVAASRLENSPFTSENHSRIADVIYFDDEWNVRLNDLDIALPIEELVERYDKIRWSKTADLYPGMDYRCPECGSHNVRPMDSGNVLGDTLMCQDCGAQGNERDFENEEPDYDQDPRYDDLLAKVAEGVSSFEYNLPPAGIHFRTHEAMKNAGLQARVHFPPGLESMFGPIPEVIDVPTNDKQAAMSVMMLDNPEQHTVQVETPHDPAQVQQVFDQAGGRHAKVAETEHGQNEPTVDTTEAIKCPKCGSHTIRAYSPEGNSATLVCLTCGNEFKRNVHINPEASVKESVMPIDPNLNAQIVGLMQQIEEAYQRGDQVTAQQLHKQMMQLMSNPNQPLVGVSAYGPTYPVDPAQQAQITDLMRQISAVADSGDIPTLRLLQERLESLLGGNPAYASMEKGSPYPSDSYKNAPDHTPKGQKKWPKEVNAIYNACMREGNGKGDTKDEKESSCAAIAWSQYEKGKKKSHVDNEDLVDTTDKFFLESLYYDPNERLADTTWDTSDPYADQQINLDEYTAPEMQEDDRNIDYAHCPACDGPGVLLGQLGNRIHYRCRNCGMDFSHKPEDDAAGQQQLDNNRGAPFGEGTGGSDATYYANYEDVKEVNQVSLKAFKDSSGNPLEAGKLYTLHHPSYKVPDVVKILNLEDGRIEAAIASDEHGSFPIHITHEDAFSLDPYEKTASGWSVLARKNFSAQEQKELIDEGKGSKARNFEKLNLDGTHYQIKEESTDPDFLLGW